jgi:hypothetical protein
VSLYLYAITERLGGPLPSDVGLDEGALIEVSCRGIAAVVSECAGTHVEPTADGLWRHERAIESLMSARTVLPARFGTLLSTVRDVERALHLGYDNFAADLVRLRDHVEVGVRLLGLPEAASCPMLPERQRPPCELQVSALRSLPGTAYLRARATAQRLRQAERGQTLYDMHAVCRALGERATASNVHTAADGSSVSAAYLVPQENLVSFRRMVTDLAKMHSQLALLCTGPWPAYSFVSSAASVGEPASHSKARGVDRHVG